MTTALKIMRKFVSKRARLMMMMAMRMKMTKRTKTVKMTKTRKMTKRIRKI